MKSLSVWDVWTVKPTSEVRQAKDDGRPAHFASPTLGLCQLKHLQNQGTVALLERSVKNDGGCKAVTEQGAPVSHVSAKLLGSIFRLLWHGWRGGCSISLHTGLSEARLLRVLRKVCSAGVDKTTTQWKTEPLECD